MSLEALLHPNWGRGGKFSNGVKGDWGRGEAGIGRGIALNFKRVCLLSGLAW